MRWTATTLLYHRDAGLTRFDAPVLAHASAAGRPSVVLAETAFYPEAGGQQADRGTLAGLAVVDVQVDDDGVVHHVLDAPADARPAVGAVVAGAIDVPRRRLFRALHTAQHALSQALIEVAAAETVSSRLGESVLTIDVDVPALDRGRAEAAVERVNGLVEEDRPVRAWFPSAEALAALPLRRRPKVSENVRVVEIDGFDVSPCGGTHVDHTAQLGLVVLEGLERYKGMVRVSFSAGRQARARLEAESRTLRALASTFSAGPLEVPPAIDKLRRELDDARAQARGLSAALAARDAAALDAQTPAPALVVARLDVGGREHLRAVGVELERRGRSSALAGVDGDGLAVVVTRGAGQAFDAGALLKRLAAAAGGKGGGRPDRAEAKLPLGVDLVALVAGLDGA
jgi:alanyl-tRNA synthetase